MIGTNNKFKKNAITEKSKKLWVKALYYLILFKDQKHPHHSTQDCITFFYKIPKAPPVPWRFPTKEPFQNDSDIIPI